MLNKFFQNYDSEEDDNYEPTAKEKKQYELEHQRKKRGKRQSSQTIHEYYAEMKEQYKESIKPKQKLQLDPVELANSILNSDSIKPDKKIIFAGKQYILNEKTGELEEVEHKISLERLRETDEDLNSQFVKMRNLHISYQYLNHVMQAIYNRSKKINAIGKSKLDWKGFVKQEGIEEKLKYNRKAGIIQNMEFIKNAK